MAFEIEVDFVKSDPVIAKTFIKSDPVITASFTKSNPVLTVTGVFEVTIEAVQTGFDYTFDFNID